MKRTMIIFGWFAVVTLFALGLLFVNNFRVVEDDFTIVRGKISGEVTTTQDEYGERNTSLRLYLAGRKGVYGLPGKLLEKANQDIYQLQDGDEVILTVRTQESRDIMAKSLDHTSIWGIEKVNGPTYLTLEQAINYHRSFRTLVYAGVFFVMAVGLGVYLVRW